MKKFSASPILFLSLAATLWLTPFTFGQDLPAGQGRDTLKKVCTQCHDIESVPRLRYSRADWTTLVYSMKDMGAEATTAELDEIIDYLTLNFGKGDEAKKINVNMAAAKDLQTMLGLTEKESGLIVDYRGKNGNFKDLPGLMKVDGIDGSKIQAAKDKIAF